MSRFVLVHGSWHDGTAWDAVSGYLRAAGHEVFAPTLAGHGPGVSRDVGFDDYVGRLVSDIAGCGFEDFTLVGHSLGGAVVAATAGLVADQLRRVVFVAPIIPDHGKTLNDALPPESAQGFKTLAGLSTDNSITLPFALWRERFVGEADLELAQESYDTLSPEPYRPVGDLLDLHGFDSLPVGMSYIHCRSDVVFAPGPLHFFPRFFHRLPLGRLVEIDAGHEAMFTAPQALADALVRASRD